MIKNGHSQRSGASGYTEIIEVLKKGDADALEFAAETVGGFPHGRDGYLGRHWISNAIDVGSQKAVAWMIGKGVDLNFDAEDGFTVLHSCIDRANADRYEVLKMLLEAGADPNAHGINDWTPLHMAAMRDDERYMEMLLEAGADRTRRTRIDDCTTPEEEARLLGHVKSAEFIAGYRQR